MVIESINVSVPGGKDGAFDKVGVLSVSNVVERVINVLNEAAGFVVQFVCAPWERS
jgi:hypothetical protein